MIYPSIDKLLTIIDSKYKLVHIAASRSKQMTKNNYYQMNEKDYKAKKNIGRSLEEVYENLIKINNN